MTRTRRFTASVLTATLLLLVLLGPAGTVAADDETQAFWAQLFNKQLKLKGTPIVHADAIGDGIDVATGRAIDTPGYADATDFAYLVTDLKKPQVNALAKKQRGNDVQPILGVKASPQAGQTWAFVGARTAAAMPRGVPGGVQFNIILDGKDAVPLYGGGSNDLIAGSQELIISGQFDNFDQLLSGATNTAGTERGGRPDYNNKQARTSGYVKDRVWLVGVPLPKGAQLARFSFQATNDGHQIIDSLATPGGVNIFPLRGPAVPDDFCYSGGIFPVLDASGEVVEYQVELALESGQPLTEEQLAAISVVSHADGEAAPAPGAWQVFPSVNGAYGNFIVPRGPTRISLDTWRTSDEAPDIGATALLGDATLDLTGTDSGRAFGMRQCALLPLLDGGIPDGVGEAWAEYLGYGATDIEQFAIDGADGSSASVVFAPEVERAIVAMVAGNRPSTAADFERRAATSFCDTVSVPLGAAGIRERCPNGTDRLFWFTPFENADGPLEFGRIFTVELIPGPPDSEPVGEPMSFDVPLSAELIILTAALETPFLLP